MIFADDSWTNPIWEAVRDRRQVFADGRVRVGQRQFNLSSGAAADMVDGHVRERRHVRHARRPRRGRPHLHGADDVRGGGPDGPVAVISYAMWQRRYGGAPDVVGRTSAIERAPFTIIGVTPKGFFGPDVGRSFDIAVPLGAEPVIRRDAQRPRRSAPTWWMSIMARLKPGQTPEQATALLRAIQPQIRAATMPDTGPGHSRRLPDRSVHARSRRPAGVRCGARATNSR